MDFAQLDTSPCPVPSWLPDGHSQTLYAALLASYPRIRFVRHRVDTPDGDFIDFDWAGPGLYTQKESKGACLNSTALIVSGKTSAVRWVTEHDWQLLRQHAHRPALILFHGLEGSSCSPYIQSIAHYFRARGWTVVIAHFRGCSGVPNRLTRAYYSGDSEDINFMLETVKIRLPRARWYAVGVSLGGNALIKYIGQSGSAAVTALSACAGVCVPLDLVASGLGLFKGWINRYLYTATFLHSMKRKILEKAVRFPNVIQAELVARVRNLQEFDDAYTAPIHGYRDAMDYWTQCSSKPWLARIQIPTLVLNAKNDPFLSKNVLPTADECSSQVLLHQPEQGGHAGFVTGRFPCHLNWLPQRLENFFEKGT